MKSINYAFNQSMRLVYQTIYSNSLWFMGEGWNSDYIYLQS